MQIESFSFESELQPFKKLNYKGFGNIVLVKGEAPMIKVSSKLDIEDALKFEVKNEELKIKVKDPISLGLKSLLRLEAPDLNVQLVYTALDEVIFNGLGNMSNTGVWECYNCRIVNNGVGKLSLNLDAKSVYCKLDGAGTSIIMGACEEVEYHLNGAGKIEGSEFVSENAVAVAQGVGRIDVRASKNLKAKLSGIGTIRHYGNPDKIESKLQGVGSIVAGD